MNYNEIINSIAAIDDVAPFFIERWRDRQKQRDELMFRIAILDEEFEYEVVDAWPPKVLKAAGVKFKTMRRKP